jgi:DNA-binding MarR family transcriptional regulator
MPRLSNQKSTTDALTLELRRFIAGVILFNQQVAERVGINPTDMQCIHLLQLMGPLTAGKLAESTGLTTGGVTVALDRMEKAGLVRRERNPQDRRSVLVRLEPKTLAGIETHYAEIGARMNAFLAAYPEPQLKTVLDFFARINSLDDAQPALPDKPKVAPPRSTASKRK